jgi:hypothetical protein
MPGLDSGLSDQGSAPLSPADGGSDYDPYPNGEVASGSGSPEVPVPAAPIDLDARHWYIARKLYDSSDAEAPLDVIEKDIRKPESYAMLDAFFRGEGPGKLLFFYQVPPRVCNL